MKVIVVDDEEAAVVSFCHDVQGIEDIQIAGMFFDAKEAYRFVQSHEVDLAVLDIQMEGINGIELGQMLKNQCPNLLLLYITASDEYAEDAVRLNADGYLTKPYTKGSLSFAINSAKTKLTHQRERQKVDKSKSIVAKTFGYFDLYVDGVPHMFRSRKAKELLALLIDREGGTVTTDQIISILWEDRPNDESTQSLCSKICKTLQGELQACGAEKMFISERGIKRVDTKQFECDLYQLLAGDKSAREKYMGEYLMDYSWAEERVPLLDKL